MGWRRGEPGPGDGAPGPADGTAATEQVFQAALDRHRREDFAAAVRGYRQVLEQAPGNVVARNNLCLALLADGDYAAGFRLYDVRLERQVGRVIRPRLPTPEWTGAPLAGRRLLVWPEQGFGDQIMFARFAVQLRERGDAVVLVAPPPLARLFRHLPLDVAEQAEGAPVPPHDCWALAGSLPGRLGVGSLPDAPYLPSATGRGGVGIATRGRPSPPGRSLPADAAARLAAITNGLRLEPEATGAHDFEATRQIIAGLDLVITIDTAVAHLSGAMGKPTWLLLSRPSDWRWGARGAHTAWYPATRLFRQPTAGDWDSVLGRVERDFADWRARQDLAQG